MRLASLGFCIVLAASVGNCVAAQDKPDNTGVNKADQQSGQPTADQQKEDKNDRMMTKKIRRAIVSDKSLSTYAHNVKVISQNGQVTLRGPVRSEDEKHAVEAKATQIAGENAVKSEISVAPKSGTDHNKQ